MILYAGPDNLTLLGSEQKQCGIRQEVFTVEPLPYKERVKPDFIV